jgi:hypothetical protein
METCTTEESRKLTEVGDLSDKQDPSESKIGGRQIRLALARLLLASPSYLDSNVRWLAAKTTPCKASMNRVPACVRE